MYTVHPSTIKLADSIATQKYGISPLELMQSAANNAVKYVKQHVTPRSKIVVLCGKGNNGGDGYQIANLLIKDFYDVKVVEVFDAVPSSAEAQYCRNEYLLAGGCVIKSKNALESLQIADTVIDCIFGVGFYGNIEMSSPVGRIVHEANNSKAYKISVDTPSGVNCADGTVSDVTFKADLTITIALIKTGLVSYPAKEFCGEVVLSDLCFPKQLYSEISYDALLIEDSYVNATLPKREQNTHKGTYGKLTAFCGSPFMTGAPYLCTMAALRTGAGLVTVAADSKTLSVLQTRLSEPVFFDVGNLRDTSCVQKLVELCNSSNAVALGCGLGKSSEVQITVNELVKSANTRLIIDADGINAILPNINVLKEAKFVPIVTPHPAEFARMSGMSATQVQNNRINAARDFSKQYNCITVLKGAATVIASPDGRTAINTTGNAGLSKGGSGDVLAGVIASLVCQGIDAFSAAACGVYLHGKAADNLAKSISQYGLLPSDLPLEIARLLP